MLLYMDSTAVFGMVATIVIVALLLIIIVVSIVRNRYRKFASEHSAALKQLREINNHYDFISIEDFDMKHSYDNENFYDNISCKDYLTYQLTYIQKRVNTAMRDTLNNKDLYQKYTKEITDTCVFDKWDTDELLGNRNRLITFEEKLFKKEMLRPTIEFVINVKLVLTNINGSYQGSKSDTFNAKEIKNIIYQLNQKRGTFYLNNDIWQALCRVERGKVTNKMRFAIYERDHNRCRKCGRRTHDLEVDHIIPISKGGKSTFDNLQTLCHRCNVRKGSNLEF